MYADDFGNQVEEGFDRSAAVTQSSRHFRQLGEAVMSLGKAAMHPFVNRREKKDAIPLLM